MDEPKSWTQKGLGLIGPALVLVVAAGVGLFTVLRSIATPIHRNAAEVPSVAHAAPLPAWAGAVEQGRRLARARVVEQSLPGLSVAVGVGADIVWAEGFGWADLDSKATVAPNTRFRIGHASKSLTSAAVGLLLEQGRIDLDAEIQRYVPAFPEKQWPVTLRQLMGHVAGVRHYDTEADYMPTTHCERASEGVPRFAADPLRFQPETQHAYSTFGWILVSAAVEAAANEPFFTFMRTRIFEPLGMRDTTSDSVSDPIPDLATFYYPKFSGDPSFGPTLAARVDYSCFAGAGGFLSTPSDLVRFGIALNKGTLLQPATVTKLQTPQQLLSGEETESGLGWTIESWPLAGEPTRLASHASRTLLGGSTSFMIFPERGIVVAVMSNTSFASMRALSLDVGQVFAEKTRLERP